MSLSYTGSHRASWSLGYSTPSSSSSRISRPLSSSGRDGLDYGTSSSNYGHLRRHDPQITRSDLSSSKRSGTYIPTSSIVARSSERIGDSASKRYTHTPSHVSSGSVRETAGRRDSYYTDVSPTANFDVGSSFDSLSRVRKTAPGHVSYRSSKNMDGVRTQTYVSSGNTRRTGKDEGAGTVISSSADPDYLSRHRQHKRESQEKVDNADKREDTKISRGRSFYLSATGRDKTEDTHIEIRNDDSPQTEKANIFENRQTEDYKDEKGISYQNVHSNMAPRSDVKEHDDVFQNDITESVQISLCDASPRNGHVKQSTLSAQSEPGDHTVLTTTKSAQASDPVTSESCQRRPTFGVVASKLYDNQTDHSKVSQSLKNTSSAETFSTLQFSEVEENILGKSSKTRGTCDGLSLNTDHHCEDHARKARANGPIKASTSNSGTTSGTTSSAAQAEIVRLESLCEARTKELTHTKMHLRDTSQAFDVMAVLANYCSTDLKAFEYPVMVRKLDTVQKQLADCVSQIADLNVQKDTLEINLAQIIQEKEEASRRAEEACVTIQKQKEEHIKLTHDMDDTHNAALTTQRDELTSKHDENVKKLTQFYDRQIDLLRLAHDRQMSDMKNESKLEMNALKISHLEEIQELRNKHDSQMEELHKQHRNKLEDITHRFESIKLTLSDKVESLRGECDELARRARNSEDALQRDADTKVQIALVPFLSLPQEIESLKTVLEMRNEENQKLRTKNMDIEKQLEEIPIARDKIISLQQKVENLEAIINIKTDHEKQLHEKCQILMRKYDRESRANKRLSMDYEQVVWRMSQSLEFGSCESLTKRHFSRSPPHSEEGSPDARHRTMSPHNDVVMRVKKRSSHSISEGDRKLRSRSATFVLEKNESSDSHSPSSSPQLKQKRWRKKSQTQDVAAEKDSLERMCHSAGAEILSDLSRRKGKLKNSETLTDINGSHVVTTSDMTSSYARSLSGVSDSGMYDSMTKSDVLDSSIISTDSEFGTSVNLSMLCDSTVDDLESGPVAGEYHSLNNLTVVEAKGLLPDMCGLNTASNGQSNSGCESEEHNQICTYQFCVTLPQEPCAVGDSVFEEFTTGSS